MKNKNVINRREAIRRSIILAGGSAASASIFSTVLAGCNVKEQPDWTPSFFTGEQAALIDEIAEILIPRTDTPGARDAKVVRYIDIIFMDCTPEEDQLAFKTGLTEFENGCQEKYESSFVDLDEEQKNEYLQMLHDEAVDHEGDAPPFFNVIRQMTVIGYFTSEEGATQALAFDQVPGVNIPCMPLEEQGNRVWAL